MLRKAASASPNSGSSRVRLVRKRAHCAGQATLFEVIVAVAILTTVTFGMMSFLVNGRVMVERSGQSVIAGQIAAEHLERTRDLAYGSIASSSGTETVGGILYSWVQTVTAQQADPSDASSTFKQIGVKVTWPTAPATTVILSTAVAP